MPEYAGGDRRPIASRNLPVFQRLAAAVARAGVSANAISVAGMLFGLAAGALLAATQFGGTLPTLSLLFAASAAAIQLRLLANMLDGMVAIAAGKASPVGELFNELPDRISDTAILVGAGYAAASHPVLGWAAAAVALFVTYIRALGKGLGVPGLFHGPMAKSHRMFLLTLASLAMALLPLGAWQTSLTLAGEPLSILDLALLLVILGGIVTAFRRLHALVSALRRPATPGDPR